MTTTWDPDQLDRAQRQTERFLPPPDDHRTITIDTRRVGPARPFSEAVRRRRAEALADVLASSSAALALTMLLSVPKHAQHAVLTKWITESNVRFDGPDVAPLPALFATLPTGKYSLEVWQLLFAHAGYVAGKPDYTGYRIPRPDEPLTLWRAATASRASGIHWGNRMTALGVAWAIFGGRVTFLDDGDEPLALWRATVPPEALWIHITQDNGFTQWGLDPAAITPEHVADLAPDRTKTP